MRKYEVIIAPEAEVGIEEAFDYIHERSPGNAARWLRELYRRIDTLERFPERCGSARERAYFDEDLRQLLFKSHRVVFRIDKTRRAVHVLYFRHTRQRAIGEPPVN